MSAKNSSFRFSTFSLSRSFSPRRFIYGIGTSDSSTFSVSYFVQWSPLSSPNVSTGLCPKSGLIKVFGVRREGRKKLPPCESTAYLAHNPAVVLGVQTYAEKVDSLVPGMVLTPSAHRVGGSRDLKVGIL